MRDFGEYLRAYRTYVSASLGWGKAMRAALLWLAGLLIPFIAKTLELVTLPTWVAIAWMAAWALLGYVIAPYGMWKHQRAQNVSLNRAGGT
jgi:hypothetical protein